jgi:WD40 repeat protein
VVIRDEKTGAVTRINAGEEDLGRPVLSPNNEVFVIPEIVCDETGGEGSGSVYLRVFDVKTRKLIRKLTIVEGAYGGLTPVFSPDGRTLAVGNRNYRTNLFETANWTLRHELPRSRTHEIAFSPDGTLLAAAYTDGILALWSVESGEILRTADTGCSQVQYLDWSPAGDLLATSGPKGTRIGRHMPNEQRPGKVQLWDSKKLRLVRDLVHVSQSGSVRFTRDGRHLVARFKRDNLRPETKVAIWSNRKSSVEGQ